MPFLAVGDRAIYHERHGSGPPVLFLHGAGSNAATWWQQLPSFAAHHTCVTTDLRCFGRSAAPIEEFGYTRFVADALALLDHHGFARVVVVGQSLGGMVGLRLALEHPDRIAGFVACDSLLGVDLPALTEPFTRRLPAASAASIEQRALGAWFLQHHADKAHLYAQIHAFNPASHSVTPAAWQAAIGSLLAPRDLVPLDRLRRVACPTLLLVGREDPLMPVDAMQQVAEWIAGSELTVVDRAGHSAYFEQPDTFNHRVLDFIARRVDFAAAPAAATTAGDMR
jgi:3-oxoadipate enol-lactonase